jgi:single-stranded-DNA-specific exonuclease
MKYSHWKIPNHPIAVPAELEAAAGSKLLAALLVRRGLSDPCAAACFLRAGAELLEDPMLLPDMEAAVRRIDRALAAGERMAVYGDYDVDGISSACLLTEYLRSRGARCELYIPDRLEEGYGLNTAAIEALYRRGVTLIVTVDCGVTAVEETAFASSLGVDMVITDHHECLNALPAAVAVVDPKRTDGGPYPGRGRGGGGGGGKRGGGRAGHPM